MWSFTSRVFSIFLIGISVSMIGVTSTLNTIVSNNNYLSFLLSDQECSNDKTEELESERSIQGTRGKIPNDSVPCPGPPNEGFFAKVCHFTCDAQNTCRYSPSSKIFFCFCPKLGKNERYTGNCLSPSSSAAPQAPADYTQACIKHCNYLNEDPNLCFQNDNTPPCVCHTNSPGAPSKR